jgi:hypothetical protein
MESGSTRAAAACSRSTADRSSAVSGVVSVAWIKAARREGACQGQTRDCARPD